MSLRKAGGNWVEGDRFFDREAEIEALLERVEDGTHTLVTAQRRMGKTSLVRELLRRLKEDGNFATVFVDLEDAALAADAVVEIAAASRKVRGLWTRLKDWIEKSTNTVTGRIDELGVSDLRVKLRAGIDAGSWRAKGDAPRCSRRWPRVRSPSCDRRTPDLGHEVAVRIGDLLHVLEHDGYLTQHGDGYRFVSGLVEDWWRARHAQRFVPFRRRLTQTGSIGDGHPDQGLQPGIPHGRRA